MSNQKEYLVTVVVPVTFHVQCFAENIEDLRNLEDNRKLLPKETQDRLSALELTTGLSDSPFGEMVDRHLTIEEVVSVDEAIWEV